MSSVSFNSSADCDLARQFAEDPLARISSAVLIVISLCVLLALAALCSQYAKYRDNLAIHCNLKLLYASIALLYGLGSVCHLISELHYMWLVLFSPSSSDPCAYLVPFWFALLCRLTLMIQINGVPLLYCAIVFERLRATFLAGTYERERHHFGMAILVTVVGIDLLVNYNLAYGAIHDYGTDLSRRLPFNSISGKTTKDYIVAIFCVQVLMDILTAFGCAILFRVNKRLRNRNSRDPQQRGTYNLSENYQLQENIVAMRFNLPLDIAYVLVNSLYDSFQVYVRILQPQIGTARLYTLLNFGAAFFLLYYIVSLLYYRHFLGGIRQAVGGIKVVPADHLAKTYFAQLEEQWHGQRTTKRLLFLG